MCQNVLILNHINYWVYKTIFLLLVKNYLKFNLIIMTFYNLPQLEYLPIMYLLLYTTHIFKTHPNLNYCIS